jgi:ankyrin repeat protein
VEFLKILRAECILDLELFDNYNWTVLHRASAFGTAEDVHYLLQLGASPFTEDSTLRWSAIHHAVEAGNWPTFSTLIPSYSNGTNDMVDARGWSLLHVAASVGSKEIIRSLLESGASPDSLSLPCWSRIEPSLYGRRCTPEDVAEGYGPEKHAIYLVVLKDFGVLKETDEGIEEEETFWDAEELISI